MTRDTDTQAGISPRHRTIELEGSAGPSCMFDHLRKRNERRALVARMLRAKRAEGAPRTTTPTAW